MRELTCSYSICYNKMPQTISSFPTRKANSMSEEHDEEQHGEQHPIIKLKPTRFDRVLDVVVGLMILVMWGIAIVQLFCPKDTNHWDDLLFFFVHAIIITCFAVWFYRDPPFSPQNSSGIFFVKITDENAERQFRLRATFWKLLLIPLGLLFISTRVIGLWPLEIRDSLRDASVNLFFGLIFCVFIWYSIRAWQLR